MARPLRVLYKEAYYHVMNRGRNRQDIFLDSSDYKSFLSLLREVHELFDVKILCYCLMKNHYHLLVQTAHANLPEVMRHINSVYVQRFNRRHGLDGSLFKGRYKDVLVQEDLYLARLFAYIHLNPVKANVVKTPEEYRWSSHSHFNDGRDQGAWLSTRYALSHLSEDPLDAIRLYRESIGRGIDKETEDFYSKERLKPFFGSESFVRKSEADAVEGELGKASEIAQKKRILGVKMLRLISKVMKDDFGATEASLKKSSHGKENLPKKMGIALARDLSRLPHRHIAEYFGLSSSHSVGKQYSRFMDEIRVRPDMKDKYESLKLKCL